MMLIGIIGAPNKGKSTLFSALTMASAEIADYPFTTIKPNHGVAYVARECVERELKVRCTPKNGICKDGTRYIPIQIVDVAGLVPGAHLGKGMGNQFLTDAICADVLIQVVDLSGKTDVSGNSAENANPAEDVRMIADELAHWICGIIKKHISGIAKRKDGAKALHEMLAGLRVSESQIEQAISACSLTSSNIGWDDSDIGAFSRELLRISKPLVVAANKADVAPPGALEKLREELKGFTVVGCSAAIELALKKAAKAGAIDYNPGEKDFGIIGSLSPEQTKALEYMRAFVKKNGTGVQRLLNSVVFDVLKMIVVYPVEDEGKYTNHFGEVLPDALLVERGKNVHDLAAKIHSDLARNMLYAIDAKRRMRVNREYELKDSDVIKIVSAAK
ncbi:MAG: redox-regulated ATPase YchF [Candidatus Micrarchaeota archaeon]|nr:redox-regulated ATPase YchF [Candidatus Micrarchaeota archaeon]